MASSLNAVAVAKPNPWLGAGDPSLVLPIDALPIEVAYRRTLLRVLSRPPEDRKFIVIYAMGGLGNIFRALGSALLGAVVHNRILLLHPKNEWMRMFFEERPGLPLYWTQALEAGVLPPGFTRPTDGLYPKLVQQKSKDTIHDFLATPGNLDATIWRVETEAVNFVAIDHDPNWDWFLKLPRWDTAHKRNVHAKRRAEWGGLQVITGGQWTSRFLRTIGDTQTEVGCLEGGFTSQRRSRKATVKFTLTWRLRGQPCASLNGLC